MVDTHSHVLWNVDDGPITFEQSLQITGQMIKAGVTDVIVTPHYLHPQFTVSRALVTAKLDLLQKKLVSNQVPLTLHRGHEVRVHERLLEQLTNQEIFTLANSNYLLLELPSNNIPHYTYAIIKRLVAQGILPIIAHPERNYVLYKNPQYLEKMIHLGAFAQVTAGSLTGLFGRAIQKFAIQLVRANYVHTYGSDVHNSSTRAFQFSEGLFILEKQKLANVIDILLENNERILRNEPFLVSEPEKIKSKWSRIMDFTRANV